MVIRSQGRHRNRRLTLFLVTLLCLSNLPASVEAKRKPKSDVDAVLTPVDEDIPGVHNLFEFIGKAAYKQIARPKYRFYIYFMGYSLPDERTTIIALSTLCNVLYGSFVLIGFIIFPRDTMLIGTLMTLYIGPAFILLLIGALIGLLAAFAMYPITSVFCIWLWFFLTSQSAQVIGRYLGLDHDQDGDVDLLDLVHYLAQTRIGKYIGLEKLHAYLNKMSMDPFQAIHARLDRIQQKMESLDRVANRTRGAMRTVASPENRKIHRE